MIVRKRGGKGRRRLPDSRNAIPHPPPLNNLNIAFTGRLRFFVQSSFDGPIQVQNIFDTLVIATAATTAVELFSHLRVRKVEAWCNGLTNTSAQLALQFYGIISGDVTGDDRIHTDSSMGITPAHIRCVPSKRSLASNWTTSTTSNLFDAVFPVGTIVDVDVEFRRSLNGGTSSAASALVGASTGYIYARGLDGLPVATSKFLPQGWQDIL